MPVEVPNLASTDTVNAVALGSSLTTTCAAHTVTFVYQQGVVRTCYRCATTSVLPYASHTVALAVEATASLLHSKLSQ
eukprot:3852-Heterococcus_DN1.PRE.4